MEPKEEKRLANQLLGAESEEQKVKDEKPKRNSKDAIRQQILRVVEKYELDFDYSDTKMKRMNKEQLQKVLAEVMETSVQQDMAKAVGVDPRAKGKVVSLGALRMLHNICATGFEKGFNAFAPGLAGVECEGFATSLRHPDVQPTVDECLAEIAAENPDVLEYFDSPYSRLALIWLGVISTSIKKAHVHRMGPRAGSRQAPRGFGRGRGAPLREEHSRDEPSVQTV